MNRPTAATFRAQWPAEAMGICQADPRVLTYCNDAQQRLLIDPLTPDEGWWGGSVSLAIAATIVNGQAYVTTPMEIARLIVLAVCKTPIVMRNRFYEYIRFGSGVMPKDCCQGACPQQFNAFERPNVVTFSDLLSTPQQIRIYPLDSRDVGKRVLLEGLDQNDKPIFHTDTNTGGSGSGEFVTLASPFVTSANQFSKITGIQKDQTYGRLEFFQVDPTTLIELDLSVMEPGEAVANYRRYFIHGVPSANLCCAESTSLSLQAEGRIEFVPVANETDYLTIQCVPALVEEALSIRYSRMDSQRAKENAVLHHSRAISLLNGQLDHYEGKINTAISVPIFGSSRMSRQPV